MYALFRLTSIVIAIGLFMLFPISTFGFVVTAVGVAHYLQAFYTSRKQLRSNFIDIFSVKPVRGAILWVVITVIVAMAFLDKPGILFVFGIHHILSEVYLFREDLVTEVEKKIGIYSRLALNFLFFFFLAYRNFLSFTLVLSFVGFFGLGLLYYVYKLYKNGRKGLALDVLFFELIGLATIVIFRDAPRVFLVVVLYHFIIWWFISIFRSQKDGRVALFVQQAVLTGALIYFLRFSPTFNLNIFSFKGSYNWLVFWGYIHIGLSFFVSKLNPQIILNLQLGPKQNLSTKVVS